MKRLLLRLSLALLFAAYPAAGHADLTAEPAQVRERMHAIAQHVASFANRFGVSSMETDALGLVSEWETIDPDVLAAIWPESGNLSGLQSLENTETALRDLLTQVDAEAKNHDTEKSAPRDPDWPEKSCELGLAWAGRWSLSMGLAVAHNSLETVAAGLKWKCDKIEISKIGFLPEKEVMPFGFGDAGDRGREETCRATMEDGKVEVPLHRFSGHGLLVEGGEGGSLSKTIPGLERACSTIEHTAHVVGQLGTYADIVGGCWTQGTAIANNGRLTVVRDKMAEVQDRLVTLQRLVVEGNLAVRGGLRTGSLYLPSEEEGALDLVRGYTREAIDQTEASGYHMKPEIQKLWSQAEAFRADGNYKLAYDRYRAAYSRATVKSFKQLGTPSN